MRLAVLAAVDLVSREVGIVGETHGCGRLVVTVKRCGGCQGLAFVARKVDVRWGKIDLF